MRPVVRSGILRRGAAVVTAALAVSGCGRDPGSLHRVAVVVDLHADTIGPVLGGRDFARDNRWGHVDLPKLRRGGIDLFFWSIWVPPGVGVSPAEYRRGAEAQIAGVKALVERFPDDLMLVRNEAEVRAAVRAGKVGCALGLEGGHLLGESLEGLRAFYARGVRYLTLTWNNSNVFASSATDEASGSVAEPGLTPLGRELVAEMNRLGMLIDVSHIGPESLRQVLELSTDPVIATHSGCAALTPNIRNLEDEQLRALARRGGVVGIPFVSQFLDRGYAERRRAALAEAGGTGRLTEELFDEQRDRYFALQDSLLGARASVVRPPLSAFLDHIDHLVRVAGVEAVALGSDFDGTSLTPLGIDSIGDEPMVTVALRERGYRDDEIRKMLGGNFLRTFARVCGR